MISGSATWAARPLTTGILRRYLPSLRGTVWRNKGGGGGGGGTREETLAPYSSLKCTILTLIISGFPRTLEKSGKWPFYGKSGKSQGICQAPQGILEIRKVSGNSQWILALADLSSASEKCYTVSICFALSFQTSIMYGSIYSFSVYKKTQLFL